MQLSGLAEQLPTTEYWVEVGGERTPLLETRAGFGFVVPLFMRAGDDWPSAPAGALDVTVHSSQGLIAAASAAFTVEELQRVDGVAALAVAQLGSVGTSVRRLAYASAPSEVGAVPLLHAYSHALDSLEYAPQFSLATALEDLAAHPEELALLDALLASNGLYNRHIRHMAILDRVTTALPFPNASAAAAMPGAAAVLSEQELSDEMLSQLMQLAAYLQHNTAFMSETAADISDATGLASAMSGKLDQLLNKTRISLVLNLISLHTTLKAHILNKLVISALPTRLDSLTLDLASDTLRTEEQTDATIMAYASNEPQDVSIGEIASVFQSFAGLVPGADRLEAAANFFVQRASGLLQSFADGNPWFVYDSDILELGSLPEMKFSARVVNPDFVVLHSFQMSVVAPLEGAVNWIAVADSSGSARITARVAPNVDNVPDIAEWFADFISENAGSSVEDMNLGAFGTDILATPALDVFVRKPAWERHFRFETDLEGWETGTAEGAAGWGTAEWRDWCGEGRPAGCVKLDGVGGPGEANAWIYQEFQLPDDVSTLEFETTHHDRAGSSSEYRIRVVDGFGNSHVLIGWAGTGGAGMSWQKHTVSLTPWAGQSVTLYFEGGDNGPGTHEQRYYDNIRIW